MCKCNPKIRTPWCGKQGCEMPVQKHDCSQYLENNMVPDYCRLCGRRLEVKSIQQLVLEQSYPASQYIGGRVVSPENVVKLIEKAVRIEAGRIKRIVENSTPSHVTREYRDTDAMRDKILKSIDL